MIDCSPIERGKVDSQECEKSRDLNLLSMVGKVRAKVLVDLINKFIPVVGPAGGDVLRQHPHHGHRSGGGLLQVDGLRNHRHHHHGSLRTPHLEVPAPLPHHRRHQGWAGGSPGTPVPRHHPRALHRWVTGSCLVMVVCVYGWL